MHNQLTTIVQVLTGHAREDGLLSDYCDGTAYKSHPLFSCTSHCLELILYYDDVELCNPLGSRAKTHKLGKCSIEKAYIPGYLGLSGALLCFSV